MLEQYRVLFLENIDEHHKIANRSSVFYGRSLTLPSVVKKIAPVRDADKLERGFVETFALQA